MLDQEATRRGPKARRSSRDHRSMHSLDGGCHVPLDHCHYSFVCERHHWHYRLWQCCHVLRQICGRPRANSLRRPEPMRVLNSEGVPRKRQGEGWWILLQEGADAVETEASPPAAGHTTAAAYTDSSCARRKAPAPELSWIRFNSSLDGTQKGSIEGATVP